MDNRPLWLRIQDWCQCGANEAQRVATEIIRRNPYYWSLPEPDLKALALATYILVTTEAAQPC